MTQPDSPNGSPGVQQAETLIDAVATKLSAIGIVATRLSDMNIHSPFGAGAVVRRSPDDDPGFVLISVEAGESGIIYLTAGVCCEVNQNDRASLLEFANSWNREFVSPAMYIQDDGAVGGSLQLQHKTLPELVAKVPEFVGFALVNGLLQSADDARHRFVDAGFSASLWDFNEQAIRRLLLQSVMPDIEAFAAELPSEEEIQRALDSLP